MNIVGQDRPATPSPRALVYLLVRILNDAEFDESKRHVIAEVAAGR